MKLNKILFLPLLLIYSTANAASYVYITDKVEIPLRSENKVQNKPSNLLRMLPSGAKLKVLANENGWSKVKFEQTIGWMISRYLDNDPPAREQLKELKQINDNNKLKINTQQERNTNLEKELKNLKTDNTDLSTKVNKAKAEKQHIEQTYKNALKLEYDNEKLKKQALQLKTEIQLLQNNGLTGQDASSRNWFIVGALVLFFGFIIGFIFSNKRTGPNNHRRF